MLFRSTFLRKNRRPIEVEDVEKGVIVEDVDTCASSVEAAMGYGLTPMNIIEEQGIPRTDQLNTSKKGGGR